MCVCLNGLGLGTQKRKGSFEEVTDEARGTGQRKFARWWYRAAERNFSPSRLERQRHRGSGRTNPAAEGAFVSSPHQQRQLY